MNTKNFLIILLTLVGSTSLQKTYAQEFEQYIYSLPNSKNFISEKLDWKEKDELLQSIFSFKDYPNLHFQEKYATKSLGGTHYTLQAYYDGIALEQVMVKITCNNQGEIRLLQHNLPKQEFWANFQQMENLSADNWVYIFIEDKFILAQKKYIQNEKLDQYENRFYLEDGTFFRNELKYHIDTTAYAKIFKPDPLSSAGVVYGGNYQDGFQYDTTALVIQNLNNPGGSTITANSTVYNFDGQSFNVPSESYVNSSAAPIIRQYFTNIFLDGQGTVVGFNTAITDNPSNLTTAIIIEDYNYPALDQERFWGEIPVDFSNGVFNLSNDFFIISDLSPPFTNPSASLNDTFDFTRNLIDFEDVNAFYHLNRYKAYWEDLGFTDLASEVIMVDAHGNNGTDNSFFSPSTPPRLVFGQGGVDDAEDADVIIHEYGHAISSFASPGSNVGDERRALDEGFGDYLATSYSKQFTNFGANDVFTWDGHNEFWLGRNSNTNKTKLDISIDQNIYYNGEVWSATLNDLYEELGDTVADKLAIEVMYYNMPNSSISDAAFNLFFADTLLYGGIHSCEIFDVLFSRKFLMGTCLDFYSGIQDNFADDQGVRLLNSYGFTKNNEDLVLEFVHADYQNSFVFIYDIQGQIVAKFTPQSARTTLNLKHVSPGTYFMELNTKNNSYRFKLLKN